MKSKLNAARKAAELVNDGMVIGIGSGSTVELFIREIGKRIQTEGIEVWGVVTSYQSHLLAVENGITVTDLFQFSELDLCVDGVDQIDSNFNCIKGKGGALAREKIVASASDRFVIIADSSKLTEKLSIPVPIEVIPFAYGYVLRKIAELGGKCELRIGSGKVGPVITDNGNFIADCEFGIINEPKMLEKELNSIAGVIENGIFPTEIVSQVIIGFEDKARTLKT